MSYLKHFTIQRESLANSLFSSIWRKKVWRINRSANRLLIVSTNLDRFSLVNHGRFAKLSCYTVQHFNYLLCMCVGMGDYKNFMSRYIMRIIILIIAQYHLTVLQSLNCEEKMEAFYSYACFCAINLTITMLFYDNIMLTILQYLKYLFDIDYHDTFVSQ